MSEPDLERSEAATPYKLQKARERGQVARSPDLVSAAVLLVAAGYAVSRGREDLLTLVGGAGRMLAEVGRDAHNPQRVVQVLADALQLGALLLAPFFGALVLMAILASVAQTGPVLSPASLQPDWTRLNPATGLRRIVGRRAPYDLLRAAVKLGAIALIAKAAIDRLLPLQTLWMALPPAVQLARFQPVLEALLLQVGAVLLVVAIVDVGFVRAEFARKMRMSRRELTDEHRHREGDPRIKRRLREIRRQWLRRAQALQRTAQADVVLTNPTHYAVALRYAESEMSAPQVVAKGAGVMAAAIRRIASIHGVPVVPNPPLARRLFHELDIEQSIPPTAYAEVARILVWVFARRRPPGRTA